MRTIRLEKTNEVGNIQFWECSVDGVTIKTEWGVIAGKVQEKFEDIFEGKNIGKINEITAEEVAIDVLNRKARGKLDRGYTLIKGKIDNPKSKVARETNFDIPKPMLANKFQDHANKFKLDDIIIVQPKLDGNRCLINLKTAKMYSRGRKEIVSLPHIVANVIKACSVLNSDFDVEWVDGELYSHALSFNEMQSIIRKSKTIDPEKAKEIEYHIFDYISDDSFLTRNKGMMLGIKGNNVVKQVLAKAIKVNDLPKAHKQYVNDGYEGIMVRTADGPYEFKRSKTLFKYKTFQDEEFECVEVVLERGTIDKCGRLTLKTKDGQEFGARPACSDAEKVWMWKNRKKLIGKIVTVEFQEKSEDNIPRFPIAKGFRDIEFDK